jgi:hypothetical protein
MTQDRGLNKIGNLFPGRGARPCAPTCLITHRVESEQNAPSAYDEQKYSCLQPFA